MDFEITNLTLRHLVLELKTIIEGSHLNKVQELDNGWLKIRIHTKSGGKNLIVTPNSFFLSNYKMDARQMSSGFGAFLKKYLSNRRILSFEQHEFERIIKIEFEEYYLFLELFGKGNILFTNKEFEIIRPFRSREWKSRSLKKGKVYEFPPERGKNPLTFKETDLIKVFKESEKDSIRTIVSAVNAAPVFCEQSLKDAGIGFASPAKEIDEKKIIKATESIKMFYSFEIGLKEAVLIEENSKKSLLPFSLEIKKEFEIQRFESVNFALNELLAKDVAQKESLKIEQIHSSEKNAIQRTLDTQKQAIEKFNKLEIDSRKKAEYIYANYAQINQAILLVREMKEQKKDEKQIMYKLNSLGLKIKKLSMKEKKLVFENDL